MIPDVPYLFPLRVIQRTNHDANFTTPFADPPERCCLGTATAHATGHVDNSPPAVCSSPVFGSSQNLRALQIDMADSRRANRSPGNQQCWRMLGPMQFDFQSAKTTEAGTCDARNCSHAMGRFGGIAGKRRDAY